MNTISRLGSSLDSSSHLGQAVSRVKHFSSAAAAALALAGCATGPYYSVPTTQHSERVRVLPDGKVERRVDIRMRQEVYSNGQVCTNQTNQSQVNGRVVNQEQRTDCRPNYNNSYRWRYR